MRGQFPAQIEAKLIEIAPRDFSQTRRSSGAFCLSGCGRSDFIDREKIWMRF
jgi:hypothetical protein